jgi:exonuclease SbcC
MEIISITLKNFKTHRDRHFIFQPGTNAICGENGAGKTSILEAIAWTLFNYRGAYRIDDLIHNGASSAQATVSFISNRDGRTYDVQRCTNRGYTIFDPQLGQKLDYKHIEEEVLPWLRQHLGVSPGTDLGRLFANTIGVPQGTFTADFLQTPENRKRVFDAILKVEEYKQANKDMLSLEKYAKAEEETLIRAIAQYDETLAALEPTQIERQQVAAEIAAATATLNTLKQDLAKVIQTQQKLAAQAKQVQEAEQQVRSLLAQVNGQRQANTVLVAAVEQSRQSVATCQANLSSYQAFQMVEAELKRLDQQRKQQQKLLKQREQEQQRLAERQNELTRLELQLENLTVAQQEIDQLTPLIEQQTDLERQQSEVAEQLNQCQTWKREQTDLTRQQKRHQADLTKINQEIQRLQGLESTIQQIPELEQRRDRLQTQLSRIEAAMQFEVDLRALVTQGGERRDRHRAQTDAALELLRGMQGVVPLLTTDSIDSVLAALQSGADLNRDLLAMLEEILADLAEQTDGTRLQQQVKQTQQSLDQAYKAQAEFAGLAHQVSQQHRINTDLTEGQQRLQALKSALAEETTWQQRRSQLNEAIKELGNPKERCKLLEKQLAERPGLEQQHHILEATQQDIANNIAQINEQLDTFASLDQEIEQHQDQRQQHHPGYLAYIQHQNEAESLESREAELQKAIAQLGNLETSHRLAQQTLNQLQANFDPQAKATVDEQYNHLRSQVDRLEGSLPQQRKLLENLDKQLAAFEDIAEKRDRAKTDQKAKMKVRKFITFARSAYKKAGPRITEQYLQSISREADRLFRELLNRPNVALEWTSDYEILVKEGAHTRRFINLSGGEQMCAALAVRLALLRVLADIDVAFFDEPTTNMDRTRRESLAEAIGQIKSFRQLFVISHDDTFEKVTENVILVQREGG